jgi:hypothetical protein
VSGPRQVALGLIHYPASASEAVRRRTRISVMGRAATQGYAIAEVFEVDGRAVRDEASMAALEAMARRLTARVVLAVGDVDRAKLEDIAQRTRMKVVTVQRHVGEAPA